VLPRLLSAVYCLALFNGRPPDIAWANVFGAGADEAVVGVLFHNVGGPADDATYGEHGGKHVIGDAQAVQDGGRVKIHVSVQIL